MKKKLFYLSILVFICTVNCSFAATITLTAVRGKSDHSGFSMDPITGKFYERIGYSGQTKVNVYDDVTAFESSNRSSLVNLTSAGPYGTYFTVNNAKLFGRDFRSGTAYSRWSLLTGAKESTVASITNMGEQNGTQTFDWGGYSTVNSLQDNTGIYILGKNLSAGWQLNKIDTDLNILETKTFAATVLGYAFMIDGNLFTSESSHSNSVNKVFNFTSETYSDVSYTLTGNSGDSFWGNAFYDIIADTLYLNNVTGGLFKIAGASRAFGVAIENTPIPEPATILLFGLGLIGVAGVTIRKG